MGMLATSTFLALMGLCLLHDLRSHRLPNRLTLTVLALGLVHATLPGGVALTAALGGAAASDLVKKLRASAKNKGAYAMAWGAHTEVDLLKGAERAGFDKVLARSAFVREMPEIVRRAVSRIRTA